MVFSIIMIILGLFAVIKGEIKVTANKRIATILSRVLGIALFAGGVVGIVVNPFISISVLAVVIIIGLLFAQQFPDGEKSGAEIPKANMSPLQPEMAFASVGASYFTENMPSLKNVDSSDTLPLPHVYSEYIVYNMRSSYKKKPGQPRQCIKCGELLKAASLQPSMSVRSDLSPRELKANHRFSYLFTCEKCHWWCFRENWKSGSINNYVFDYLVVGAIHGSAMSSNLYSSPTFNGQPWLAAMQEPNLYSEAEPLPADLKRIFPAV